MKLSKQIKGICIIVLFGVAVTANAAIVMGQQGAYSTQQYNHFKSDQLRNRHSDSGYIKQPEVIQPKMAQINNSTSGISSNTVYVLKKKRNNTLGGSLYQNKQLKQYLGRNY
jgi:hypothetical protein